MCRQNCESSDEGGRQNQLIPTRDAVDNERLSQLNMTGLFKCGTGSHYYGGLVTIIMPLWPR